MTLDTACPSCGKKCRLAKEHAGKRVRCPGCGTPFVAGSPEEGDEDESPRPTPGARQLRPAEDADDRPRPRRGRDDKDHPPGPKKGRAGLVVGLIAGAALLGAGIAVSVPF